MPASFSIIVPVKDEAPEVLTKLLQETYTTFKGAVDLTIVDDGSKVPCPVASFRHEVSRGYGRAIKTGIENVDSDWIVTMDGDGQHRLRDVQRLVEFVKDFPEVDMAVGDRRIVEKSALRYWGRKGLNWLASLFAHRFIPDLNSGLRIFRRDIFITYDSIICDKFSFTTSLTLAMLADKRKVDYLPIRVLDRPDGKSKVNVIWDGWRTLKYILVIGIAFNTRGIRRLLRPVTRILLGRWNDK